MTVQYFKDICHLSLICCKYSFIPFHPDRAPESNMLYARVYIALLSSLALACLILLCVTKRLLVHFYSAQVDIVHVLGTLIL